MPGLRETKKAKTRSDLASTAARLFGRDGYQNVTMAQVAAAAGVADQTLYNYFPTKESLVFDRSDEIEQSLVDAMTGRAAGVNVIDTYSGWLDVVVLGAAAERSLDHPGGMPRLVASSEGLQRALLDVAHRISTSLAASLVSSEGWPLPVAVTVSDALLQVMVRTIEEVGLATGRSALGDITRRTHMAVEVLRPLFSQQLT